jgi:DNA transposition AAA+ family ATPase
MADIVTLPAAGREEKPGFCPTPTARDIASALTICCKQRKMGCVVGASGVGKTTAIADFAEQHHYVMQCRMTRAAGRLQPGLVRIATAMGAYATANMGSAEIYDNILRHLSYPRDALLILDEAQHMDDDLLESVRDLYDERPVGIMLVGSAELTDRWEAKSAAKRRKWAQLTSRLTVRLDIPAVPQEDIAAMCGHHGIVGKRSLDLLTRSATRGGGLRNVNERIAHARKLAGDGPIQLNHLEDAERILGSRN